MVKDGLKIIVYKNGKPIQQTFVPFTSLSSTVQEEIDKIDKPIKTYKKITYDNNTTIKNYLKCPHYYYGYCNIEKTKKGKCKNRCALLNNKKCYKGV